MLQLGTFPILYYYVTTIVFAKADRTFQTKVYVTDFRWTRGQEDKTSFPQGQILIRGCSHCIPNQMLIWSSVLLLLFFFSTLELATCHISTTLICSYYSHHFHFNRYWQHQFPLFFFFKSDRIIKKKISLNSELMINDNLYHTSYMHSSS